jgi:DDE family transposase
MGQASNLVRPRTVTADGVGLVSRAGLVWLGEVADRSGLTAGFSQALAAAPQRRHDPGVCLVETVIALADGAECLSDLAVLRGQQALFGPVASRPTAQRAFDALGPAELRLLAGARAQARAAAWAAGAGPTGNGAMLDFDATIVPTRADKQDAAPTYKRTYGHHPLTVGLAETREMLAGLFRPGNAGANNAADHVTLLAAAIDQLPELWQAGHRPGDDPTLVRRRLTARADAGGATHWFAEACRDRNIGYSLGYWIDARVRDALVLVQEEDWKPAREANHTIRDGAQVVEITHLVNLDAWPDGTRLIVRRERPHPGAQLSLFDTIEGLRHTCFITDSGDHNIAALDLRHRRRGRAEQIIRDTKACGLARLPFNAAHLNDAWMQLALCANDLLCWARRISLDGTMRNATPKTIRHRLLHVAGHVSPRRLRLDRTWPWTTTLQTAIDQVRTKLQPLNVVLRPATHPGL